VSPDVLYPAYREEGTFTGGRSPSQPLVTYLEKHDSPNFVFISEMLHLSPDLSLQLQNGMFDSHVSRKAELYQPLPRQTFLVDASSETPVPVMTYVNVFPYAYIPRLHSTALEFPLDVS